MGSYNCGRYKSIARAYCCDTALYTEVEAPSARLQVFSKATKNWPSTRSCAEEPMLKGSLEKRAVGYLLNVLYILIHDLTELLELYSISKTEHYKAYAEEPYDQVEFCNGDAAEQDPVLTRRKVQCNEQRDVSFVLRNAPKRKC
ncbi:uncharacterized protein ATNIH1004_000860 [Aspergillus tanneri]|uniref:Uncharacterized protein n=1 Tax=Aspergillus tanneri TaxID=1220188 RepID=A0A5M9N2S5_9EURO|nr:uncharacterized protein ATNIH1004_000860 [Aspergillus tanneri]KAA8651960.1 hypothetical protein ATNIH1004_000860 [Aspergillus tanneri]